LGRGGRREAECLPRRRRKRPRMPPEPALSRAALPIRRVAALRSAPEVDLVVTTPQHSIRSIGPPGIGAGAALLRAERGAPAGLVARDFAITPRQSHPSYAALDLGTNNCRLLVARPARGGFRVIDAFSRIVRLGEGLSTTGGLSEAAMARTIEALRVCAGKLGQRKVMAGRYVATEACRRAENCTEFLDRVRDEIGIELEIISTAEEARLVVAGCAPLLHSRIPYALVFDIGGGSTEIVWLRRHGSRYGVPEILGSVSLPFGVVTFTERFGGIEVSPAIYGAMVAEAEVELQPFEREHGIR